MTTAGMIDSKVFNLSTIYDSTYLKYPIQILIMVTYRFQPEIISDGRCICHSVKIESIAENEPAKAMTEANRFLVYYTHAQC